MSRATYKQNRRNRLLTAETAGWKKCTEWHYQKTINGKLVNWWPTSFKCMIENQIYRVLDVSDIHAIANIGGVK